MAFHHRTSLWTILLLIGIAVLGLLGFVWSGVYDIGADAAHTRPMRAMIDVLRDRSIQARSRTLSMPDLDDRERILRGAGEYAEMCTGCHLAPGMTDSELRSGLYPQPPDLTKTRVDPRVAFWTIKHGVKMSAMPAWGGSHDDATIWSMVAFLQQLPRLTPAQYGQLVDQAPHDDMHEHAHAYERESEHEQHEHEHAHPDEAPHVH